MISIWLKGTNKQTNKSSSIDQRKLVALHVLSWFPLCFCQGGRSRGCGNAGCISNAHKTFILPESQSTPWGSLFKPKGKSKCTNKYLEGKVAEEKVNMHKAQSISSIVLEGIEQLSSGS